MTPKGQATATAATTTKADPYGMTTKELATTTTATATATAPTTRTARTTKATAKRQGAGVRAV
jgi:hypothetical protein